jgi:hypothetical protein
MQIHLGISSQYNMPPPYIDFEDGSGSSLFKYDVAMHGPLLGANIVW